MRKHCITILCQAVKNTVILIGCNFYSIMMVGCLFWSEIDQDSMPLSQKHMNVIVFTLTYLLQLLYIELTISFLIGRKHTVNFQNQRL